MNRYKLVCALLGITACAEPGLAGRGLGLDDLSTTPVQHLEHNGETLMRSA